MLANFLLLLVRAWVHSMGCSTQINVTRKEVCHNIEDFKEHFWADLWLIRITTPLQLDDLVQDVSEEAGQAEVLFEVVLHVESFLT